MKIRPEDKKKTAFSKEKNCDNLLWRFLDFVMLFRIIDGKGITAIIP